MSDASDGQILTRKPLGEIEAGGIAFDVRAERDDNLADRLIAKALLEVGDAQVLRFDAVQRRDFSTEHMIFAPKGPGFFDAENIDRALDDAED